ncbi:DUF4136 domain-containing protein [Haloferula sp.]|uniref:DUF4136 domain-containing protein n=1 Tax=Haloferula sp. TaxID=2497595 RepID=UPI00329D1B05
MKTPFLFLTSAAALALSSCSSTTMKVDASPVAGVDYSAYKTYEWVPLARDTANDLNEEEKQLRAAFVGEVDQIMSRRGFTKVGQGKSDLIIYARGLRKKGVNTIAYTPEGPSDVIYAPYYQPDESNTRWLGEMGPLTENTQTSARFLISEPSTDKVVWRAEGVITINDNRRQRLAEHDAKKLARELLDGFPPK